MCLAVQSEPIVYREPTPPVGKRDGEMHSSMEQDFCFHKIGGKLKTQTYSLDLGGTRF